MRPVVEEPQYKEVTITLWKERIVAYVEAHTFKRVDSSLTTKPTREQGATSADREEATDIFLINEYCDRRDAILRERLKFCIVDKEEKLEYDNCEDDECKYEYVLRVPADFSSSDLKSVGKNMDTYIKRGAAFDWYHGAGLDSGDDLASIDELADSLVSIARGKPWGYRPMQPFGPAFYDYNKRNF